MDKANVNGVDLAYEVRGEGEPVLLIHGAMIADALLPLAQHALLKDHKVVQYHKRGYGSSTGGPAGIATHAEDAKALIDFLGIAPTHVVGHSAGGTTALQLAADAPEAVASVCLLEPAIATQIPSAEAVGQVLGPIFGVLGEGDIERATDLFLRFVCGEEYRASMSENLPPDAWDQTLRNAGDVGFGDIGGVADFVFTPEQAAAVTCPALVVLGADSATTGKPVLDELGIAIGDVNPFEEMVDTARSWLPQAEKVTLPGVNHRMAFGSPNEVAQAVATFLAKHRLSVSA
jgi:pimeloyl-ACP methyl ester carboxylesterase